MIGRLLIYCINISLLLDLLVCFYCCIPCLPFCFPAGEPKQRAQIGRSSEVSLKVTETDIASLTASIRSPSGQEEPCMLKRLPNGHLGKGQGATVIECQLNGESEKSDQNNGNVQKIGMLNVKAMKKS